MMAEIFWQYSKWRNEFRKCKIGENEEKKRKSIGKAMSKIMKMNVKISMAVKNENKWLKILKANAKYESEKMTNKCGVK